MCDQKQPVFGTFIPWSLIRIAVGQIGVEMTNTEFVSGFVEIGCASSPYIVVQHGKSTFAYVELEEEQVFVE